MPKIQCLDAHIADLIAAGEVVERPASVVKELTENAIDAGAANVTVEVQRGGMSYIRVTDDGCGIAAAEAETAFLRHATSKIRTEYDLEAIGTLGFRGEALAAIAAVSKVELMTKTADEPFGTALLLDGGVVRERSEVGCPDGTTMIVRELFYNTPARLKFIKRDTAEGAAVTAVVQHAAMSHPEVAFRLIRGGKAGACHPRRRQPEKRSLRRAGAGRGPGLPVLPERGGHRRGGLRLPAGMLPGHQRVPALLRERPVCEEPHHDGSPGGSLQEPEDGGQVPLLRPPPDHEAEQRGRERPPHQDGSEVFQRKDAV